MSFIHAETLFALGSNRWAVIIRPKRFQRPERRQFTNHASAVVAVLTTPAFFFRYW